MFLAIKKYLLIASVVFAFASVAYGDLIKLGPGTSVTSAYQRSHWGVHNPQIGFFAGTLNPEGSYRNSAEYGLTLGLQPYSAFNIVGELSFSQNNQDQATNNSELQRTKLIIYGLYNFDPTNSLIFKPYAGIGVGPMLESTTARDRIELATIPTIGFDYPFDIKNNSQLSLGINTRYLISSSSIPNAFGANVIAKYWF